MACPYQSAAHWQEKALVAASQAYLNPPEQYPARSDMIMQHELGTAWHVMQFNW
jgi:hypothetical protein